MNNRQGRDGNRETDEYNSNSLNNLLFIFSVIVQFKTVWTAIGLRFSFFPPLVHTYSLHLISFYLIISKNRARYVHDSSSANNNYYLIVMNYRHIRTVNRQIVRHSKQIICWDNLAQLSKTIITTHANPRPTWVFYAVCLRAQSKILPWTSFVFVGIGFGLIWYGYLIESRGHFRARAVQDLPSNDYAVFVWATENQHIPMNMKYL